MWRPWPDEAAEGAPTRLEVDGEAFDVTARRDHPGQYDYTEWFAIWRTNAAAPLSMIGRWAVGTFYDGYKHNYTGGITWRAHPCA